MTAAASDALVVHVTGEIDMATATQLGEALQEAVTAHAHLVVDMSGVTFLDSTGLTVIIAAHRAALHRDGTLVLAGLAPAQKRLLAITGTDTVLACYPSTEAALADAFRPV